MWRASFEKLRTTLRRDAERYERLGGWKKNVGFWAGATYRLGHWAKELPPLLRAPVLVPYKLANAFFRLGYHVRISADAQIGPGLCLIHPHSILIGDVRVGEDCLLFHEVTLGTNASTGGTFPTLGDGVDVYVGARVLGDVRIGSGAKIGANCVVTSNVPDGCTVVPSANRTIPATAVAAFGARKLGSVGGMGGPG